MKKTLLALLLILLVSCPIVHAENLEWITVVENAVLPEEVVLARAYPASVTLGEQLYDLEYLLDTLLGEGWYQEERSEWDYNDTYRSADGDEPWEWRTVRIYDGDLAYREKEFSYHNPWVTGERGGEYQPPNMNMMPDESEVLCRALLDGIVPAEWLTYSNPARYIRERWAYSDRWMTDKEYASFFRQQKTHYHTFNAVTEMGIPILTQQVYAGIGVDGLSFVTIDWREFTESEDYILPLTLEEAYAMANSTRSRECNLLGAQLVYSNWVSGTETHNLCWQLLTDRGTYIVDCVLKKHWCDSYEY
jgi:hypothetical protein